MERKQLPARPSLEQYKKQAKELLKAYRSADAESIRRVARNHPRFEKLAQPGFDIGKFALADAQLVIAREHGAESWPKFARQIEVINSQMAAQSDPLAAFIEAAIWHGTLDAATAILAAHPEIAKTSIHAAAILGDEATVRRFISLDPGNVTRKERPFDGDALVYLCLSKYLRLDPERSPAFLRAANALLDAGADPNTGFVAKDEYGDFETALYGAAGVAHHAELTRLLLERGADPNDNETFYHAPETYDNAALEVLVESGKMNVDNLAGMLLRKADWHDYEGIKYLLEHDADRNDHSGDHHGNLIHHPNGGDHRVQREDDIQQHDLDDHAHKGDRGALGLVMLMAFQLVVDLIRAFGKEEKTSDDQNQIASGDFLPEDGEEWRGEADDPCE